MIRFLHFTKDKTLFVSIRLYKAKRSTEGYLGWSRSQQRSCFSKAVKDLLIQHVP